MHFVFDILGTILALGFFVGWKDKHWENVKAAVKNDNRSQPRQVNIRLVHSQQPKPQEQPKELPTNVIRINRKEGYKKLACSMCGASPNESCRPGCPVGIK
jgi:hypothetical protein